MPSTNDPIPDALRTFILEHFDTVADLEAVLLCRRQPQREWDIETIARSLYVSRDVAVAVLARLEESALIGRRHQAWQYAPRTPELTAMVDLLAATYARPLIPVTNLVHSNPRRLRRFADAFKFRKDS